MIPLFLIKRFGPTGAKIAFFGGIAVVLSIALGLFIWHERSIGAQGEITKAAIREVKVQVKIEDANTNASAARVEDATTIQNQAQEIRDATVNATSPADARAKRGCVIMRQQGRDTSRIAACR